MNTTNQFLFAISLFVTLIMASLSYMTYLRHKQREFIHLTEFWASLGLNVILGYLFQNAKPEVVALSMAGWIWPIRTLRLVLEDMSGAAIMHRWQYLVLSAGGFLTVALATFQYPFGTFAIAFAVSVFVVGITLVLEAFKRTPKEICSPLHCGMYATAGIFLLHKLSYPFWRLDAGLVNYGLFAELLTLVGFAGAGLSMYLELMKKRHDGEMDSMVNERNVKLLGQSKYSELGMMSAGIAHEINNPLAVIQARTTQLLRICRDPKKQQELSDGLEQILYTSERINRTIQGVREFVHQDEQNHVSEISLKGLVDDVLVFCGQRMKNHGVSLRFYGLEGHRVSGNKIQLEQIVLNLFNNSFDAIEFLPDKWIEMSVQQDKEKILIFFKDSGLGIPSEISSRMMEPFFSTKDLGKGTGLGLALAKGIAEKHQGNLSYVKGSPHTTFLLELPMAPLEISNSWNLPRSDLQRPLQH
ncbi:MAG TPA: ATP-binding protein [Bacteriovoracaceae bacterium]|nr:ATP-binding protein [Bacteriovoracaceae bacterium]